MNELHEQILTAIKDRKDWAERQAAWYTMRHDGIRRGNKSYPGQPDGHFPLIDASIDQHKPFYVQQIYANGSIAAFVSKKPQHAGRKAEIEAWFDYQVKQESNFEREAISGVDSTLEKGGAPVKVFWNTKRKRLQFCVCDTLHVIVPKWTEELKDADWLVHVLHLSEAQYKANPNYRKDPEFIKQIKGKGDASSNEDSSKEQEAERREGLTCGQHDQQIVLWEIYTRDPANWDRIIEQVRAEFVMPYSEGVFKEGWFPFTKWRGEIKDKGYYAPRGLAEIQAPFEQNLTKLMNVRNEWMDFHSRPMFRENPDMPGGNLGNFKTEPGAIVPANILPLDPPEIPTFLMEDMQMLRQLAEYRVKAPDLGIMQREGKDPTATQINAIVGQSGQGADLRARIFRLDLGDTYKMAWALLLQYGKENLTYILHGEAKALDASALEDCYLITPNGSADSWNKGAQMAKAHQRFQMFFGNPYVKQDELVKSVLELDEPGLVPRLYQEPQDMQAGEMEEQAMELAIMEMGFPAAIDPTDDDKAHIICTVQYVEQKQRNQEPIRPRTARLILKHGAEHTDALVQKKDPAATQLNQQLLPVNQWLSQIAAMSDPAEIAAEQAQAAGNIVQMQGPGATGPQPPTAIEGLPPGPAPIAEATV